MAVVPIHRISKEGMKDKTQEKLIQIPGIRSIEETYLTEKNGKWLLLTSKRDKEQVKKEAEKILNGITLKLMTP